MRPTTSIFISGRRPKQPVGTPIGYNAAFVRYGMSPMRYIRHLWGSRTHRKFHLKCRKTWHTAYYLQTRPPYVRGPYKKLY